MKARNNSGVALLLVLVSLMLLSVVIYEISGSSRVELSISRNSRDRLQAFLLAQSAARFALLRLTMYKDIQNLMLQNAPLPLAKGMENQIWNAPLPVFPLPKAKTEWPGHLVSVIESEGSKIPVNLLDGKEHRESDSAKVRSVKEQIQNLLTSLKEDEDDERFKDIEPEDLVANLVDWIDDNSEKSSREGGDELSDYDDIEPAYKPRNDRIPTLSEIHMVKGWNDELLKSVLPQMSASNMSTNVNPNFIAIARLKALNPRFSKEDLAAIEKRRREGLPFGTVDEFESFIRTSPDIKNGLDFKFPDDMKKGTVTRETVFTIKATGIVGDSRRNLTLTVRIDQEAPPKAKESGSSGTEDPKTEKQGKLKEPTVIFIEETP